MIKASREEDMYSHIDVIWEQDSKRYTFDIKSAKKESRSDNLPNYDINWIEIQNVRGNLGWLYGKADYIVFETYKHWLIVKRTDIITLINSKVVDKTIQNSKEFYTYYQRNGRQDIVVKVPTKDLYHIAKERLCKHE